MEEKKRKMMKKEEEIVRRDRRCKRMQPKRDICPVITYYCSEASNR